MQSSWLRRFVLQHDHEHDTTVMDRLSVTGVETKGHTDFGGRLDVHNDDLEFDEWIKSLRYAIVVCDHRYGATHDVGNRSTYQRVMHP